MRFYPIALSVDELMARSREIAGVDIVDDDIVEPLSVLHRAYSEEGALDEEGARAQTDKLLRLLTNRLRMKRDFLRHPEIVEQPVGGPLVIMGMARSGTTKLQKALAASGDFNFLPFWMNFNWSSFSGEPNESLEARIAEADAFCTWYDGRSPETKLGHPFETMEPEEETHLSEGSFVSASFIGYVESPSYAAWLGMQPPSISFEFMRDVMKYLQWQGLASPDKPWLMKAPIYNGYEPVVLGVFPNAKLVIPHRSPLKTYPSMCKLVSCFRQAYSEVPPDMTMIVEGNYMGMDAHFANRQAFPDLPILDLRFEDVAGALGATVARIYAHAGMTLSDEALRRMLQWDAEHAMHPHGEFRYTLEEYCLSESRLRERLADYFAFLDRLDKS